MGASREEKQRTHERIVRTAAARFRARGLDGIGLQELMKDAGLTHGGFYRHFASRDDLLSASVREALRQGGERMDDALASHEPPRLGDLIDQYLSTGHCEDVETSCAVSTLANDVARCGPDVRGPYTEQVRRYLALIGEQLPAGPKGENRATSLHTLAALVGAIVLARAVDDPALSRDFLQTCAGRIRRDTGSD